MMPSSSPTGAAFPYISVQDVWRGALPAGTELVGGRPGLRREVSWCTALRPRAPAFEPLRGAELVLLNPQVLEVVDARLTVPGLVASLSGMGIAALAVAGTLGPADRRAADAHGLPLLGLPAEALSRLDEIEQHVLRFIVDRRAELHERTQDLHRQLSELALAGRGLGVVLARLTELVGVPVLLERGAELQYVTAERERSLPPVIGAAVDEQRPALAEWLRDVPLSAFDPPVAARPLPLGKSRLVAPILVQGAIAGFLSLVGDDGALGELHRLALGRAANACAIEMVRAHAARDARDEAEEDLLDALTRAGPGPSGGGAQERARRKGVDLAKSYVLLAGQAEASGGAGRVRAAWERAFSTWRLPALVRDRGETVIALASLDVRRPPELPVIVDTLHRAGGAASGVSFAVGYGPVRRGPDQVLRAAREAEQALSMGRRLFGGSAAIAFSDLGLYRFLYAIQPGEPLRAFHDETLAGLQEKDRSGVLLATLEAYLAASGSPTDAASQLHLHRNTVLYRLGRIEALLGVDLRDAEVRLSLHLALKIKHVLDLSE